jgi:tRNA U55 pseudouridine synthase TruB
VARLRRLRVGPFAADDAVAWDLLEHGPVAELRARVAAPEAALVAWPSVRLEARRAAAFRQGQAVESPGATPGLARVHEEDGALIGVGTVDADGRRLRPVRILHADRPSPRVLPA